MSTEELVFSCQSFSIELSGVQLFSPVSFDVQRGQVAHITGKNGAGKSTFLRFLASENIEYAGRVMIRPRPKDVLYLPQMLAACAHLPFSLEEISQLFAIQVSQKKGLSRGENTGISDFPDWFSAAQRKKCWNDASGGERVRALLAAVMQVSGNTILLLDEPLNHLDTEATLDFQTDLIRLMESDVQKLTVFIVSHAPMELLSKHLGSRYQCVHIENQLGGARIK